MKRRLLIAAATFIAAAACSVASAPVPAPEVARFDWQLPRGFPIPLTEPDNIQTPTKFALGRRLFYDRRLSANGTQSCGDCHQQSHAFSDGKTVAVGSTGQQHTRNAMTLTNAGYNASYTWDSTKVRSLAQQALVPMFNTHPIELGVAGHEKEIVARFRSDDALFRAAFPGQRRPVSIRNIARALAAFERALISGNSPYDRLVYGDDSNAISPAAWRGMRLFFSKRAG
ncbi:MAG: di-heme enzyme, partial [Acidobacteria bacterium]|nr:di-heme enzyme [Acidobacteriota bacterium]